jgi:hypothetical protein
MLCDVTALLSLPVALAETVGNATYLLLANRDRGRRPLTLVCLSKAAISLA